jgi:hypothetical protein
MRDFRRLLLFSAVIMGLCTPGLAAVKDESRLLTAEDQTATPPLPVPATPPDTTATPPAPAPGSDDGSATDPAGQGEDLTAPPDEPPDVGTGEDEGPDMSLGEIPDIKTVELTLDMAKRALDTYVLVKDKYADADIESYDNLQDFVDKNEEGKAFEADVKAAGFANVDDWNTAITSLSFAYTGVIDDPTGDIKLQIEDIQNDTSIAQDLKDKMIASLNAMIPSDNNRKVAQELMADAAYADKLKILDTAEGE